MPQPKSLLSVRRIVAVGVSGLHHLYGETISCLVNGAEHVDVVVSAYGQVTLTSDALLLPTLIANFGYSYNSDGQNLRIEAGAADGTSQGKLQRQHFTTFRLHDTLGIAWGPSFTNLVEQTFRTAAMTPGLAVPLFSGDKGATWAGGYSTENYTCWRVRKPFPATVLAVMPRLNTEDP